MRDCEHGQLARSCDRCADAAEIEELRAELAEWHKLLNPANLHANLLRGIPAQLSREQLMHLVGGDDTRTRSEKLADAGFARRPSLRAMEMRAALELIATPQRPDGTWNRDREACRELAAEALGRHDDGNAGNEGPAR